MRAVGTTSFCDLLILLLVPLSLRTSPSCERFFALRGVVFFCQLFLRSFTKIDTISSRVRADLARSSTWRAELASDSGTSTGGGLARLLLLSTRPSRGLSKEDELLLLLLLVLVLVLVLLLLLVLVLLLAGRRLLVAVGGVVVGRDAGALFLLL